jgi:hypothetical protein
MPKLEIKISLRAIEDTTKRSVGLEFAQSLYRDARLAPDLVSWSERGGETKVSSAPDFASGWWAEPAELRADGVPISARYRGPFWKHRSNPTSRGYVDHGVTNLRGETTPSTIWFEGQWDESINFYDLFRDWVQLFQPEIGMLHLFTPPEQRHVSREGDRFRRGSFGGPLNPGVPNVGWAMAYGEACAAEVDVGRLVANGYRIERCGHVVIVRVTDRLADVSENFPLFSRRRATLKTMFPPDFFWVKEEPAPASEKSS